MCMWFPSVGSGVKRVVGTNIKYYSFHFQTSMFSLKAMDPSFAFSKTVLKELFQKVCLMSPSHKLPKI